MKVAVKDANVLIDMTEADLLDLWFNLGIPTHTTDLVMAEVDEPRRNEFLARFVATRKLKIHSISAAHMAQTAILSQNHRISPADASALLLSKRLKAVLLTGDGRLRKVAGLKSVEIRGVLWIFDHLVEKGLLSGQDAVCKLKHLQSVGSFLPSDLCAERLTRWGKRQGPRTP